MKRLPEEAQNGNGQPDDAGGLDHQEPVNPRFLFSYRRSEIGLHRGTKLGEIGLRDVLAHRVTDRGHERFRLAFVHAGFSKALNRRVRVEGGSGHARIVRSRGRLASTEHPLCDGPCAFCPNRNEIHDNETDQAP